MGYPKEVPNLLQPPSKYPPHVFHKYTLVLGTLRRSLKDQAKMSSQVKPSPPVIEIRPLFLP